MPKERISEERAAVIARRLKPWEKKKGGKAKVEREAGITESVWYRALASAQLEVANAEKLELFLGIATD